MMNMRSFARIFIFSAFFIIAAMRPAWAEISIAVVDVEAIMSNSAAAQSIKKQVKEQSDKFESDMDAIEKQLTQDLEKLKKESEKLSNEEKEKKGAEFFQKRAESKKKLKAKLAALRKGEGQAISKLTDSIFEVCAKLAEEKKYDLIITRGNVIVGTKSLDITEEVMKKLNEALPSVKMTVPAE